MIYYPLNRMCVNNHDGLPVAPKLCPVRNAWTQVLKAWSTIYMEGTLTSGNDDWGANRSMEWDHLLTSKTLVLPTLTIRQYLFNMQTICFKNFHDDS